MQRTPFFWRSRDQGEQERVSKDRTSSAPLLTSSRHSAAPTKPRPPVTTKRFPSIPSFSLRCISIPQSPSLESPAIKGRRE
ncbi:hypothetical protein MA16_Dca013443 [Dendrobium catenatum]|uniref:Uncharacterized protein n=1 Tax=Dendrobium catenatum TaxID=906689 RepID=A0A2I0WPT8_9ASPA|nr:hypothetical protein MA16_Dca013443 [Dendrobium catenatum]